MVSSVVSKLEYYIGAPLTRSNVKVDAQTASSAKPETDVVSKEQTDPVTLSPSAMAMMAGKSDETKPFIDVTRDARASMDQRYAEMKESGKPFDINSSEGKDWYTLFQDLDRRALFAVSMNSEGLFSKQEQDIAQSLMSQQQGLAMGLYGGPTRLMGNFADPYAGNNAARMKAGIDFLDSVSAEEKGSVAWAFQRASVQFSYEVSLPEGVIPENVESDNPLVKMLASAMKGLAKSGKGFMTTGNVRSLDDLRKQPFLQDDPMKDLLTKALKDFEIYKKETLGL